MTRCCHTCTSTCTYRCEYTVLRWANKEMSVDKILSQYYILCVHVQSKVQVVEGWFGNRKYIQCKLARIFVSKKFVFKILFSKIEQSVTSLQILWKVRQWCLVSASSVSFMIV